jgi:hypothetical protein
MLKILYAAGRNSNAKIQLSRFLSAVAGQPYLIKIAAFRCSSPLGKSIDWTLDCLLDLFRPEVPHSDNHNFSIYYDQVRRFAPDLVISDLEHFTSHIATQLDIPLWQCSSSLIDFALSPTQKGDSHLRTRYGYLLKRFDTHRQWQKGVINNSDRNFVCSHFGDVPSPPDLNLNFEWIRPYYQIGKKSIPCQHNIVAGMLHNRKDILSLLRNYPDSITFSDFRHEQYQNLQLKDIGNQEEYFCNLANSRLFVCEGQTNFLADAFYNGKYSIVMTNFGDLECVINSVYSEYFGLSTSIYDPDADLIKFLDQSVPAHPNHRIGFLHERLCEV